MKKVKNLKFTLNKKSISSLDQEMISGAGTLGCSGFCSVGGCQSANQMCTAYSILCDNGPSEFGAGGCTFEQEK